MGQGESAQRSATQVIEATLADELGNQWTENAGPKVYHKVQHLPGERRVQLTLGLCTHPFPHCQYVCPSPNKHVAVCHGTLTDNYLAHWTRVALLRLLGVSAGAGNSEITYCLSVTDKYDFRCLVRPLGLWFGLCQHSLSFYHQSPGDSLVSPALYARLLWELRSARPGEQLGDGARKELVRVHPHRRTGARHVRSLNELHSRLFMSLFAPELRAMLLCLDLPLELRALVASHYVFLFALDVCWHG